jgi:hypothetical protein
VLDDAHAFWLRAPGRGEIRPVALPEPGSGDVMVRTLRSGVSRAMLKLGVHDRAQLVVFAFHAGLAVPRAEAAAPHALVLERAS